MSKILSSLAVAAMLAVSVPALGAAEPPKPAAAQLSALCASCAIVGGTHSEKRKGKASGVGAVGGAVAGGVVGHKVGDNTVATAGGAVVGGLLGNEIEKRMKSHTVWITTVTLKDGSTRSFEQDSDPHFAAGEVVTVDGHVLRKQAAPQAAQSKK